MTRWLMNGLVSGGAALSQVIDDAGALLGTLGTLKATLSFLPRGDSDVGDKQDPIKDGWVLVVPDDEEGRRIVAALAPLVERRVAASRKPEDAIRFFPARSRDEPHLGAWIEEEIIERVPRPGDDQPLYVLVAGTPDKIPFELDYQIGSGSSRVGRLDFTSVDDYAAYARKVLAWEPADDGGASGRGDVPIGIFATDHGALDPTRQSRKFLANGLVDWLGASDADRRKVVHVASEASRATLLGMLRGDDAAFTGPRLLFSATHGLAVPGPTAEERADRLRRQGAICCQQAPFRGDEILTADGLGDGALLAGGIWMIFACFGAGTPASSDFFQTLGDPSLLGFHDGGPFVAELPKRLLANPDGPLAVIGHLDPGFVNSFSNPMGTGGGRRGKIFGTLNGLLTGTRAGPAVNPLSGMANQLRTRLLGLVNEVPKKLHMPITAPPMELAQKLTGEGASDDAVELGASLLECAVSLNDFRNFVVLGDPAVRLPRASATRAGATVTFSTPSAAAGDTPDPDAGVPPPIAAAKREDRLVLASAAELFSAAGVPIKPEVTTVVALISAACTDVAQVRERPKEDQPAGAAVPRFYEAIEHQDCDMDALIRFSATEARAAPSVRLALPNGVRLRYGEAVSLFGDFYGVPGVRVGDGEEAFLAVWNTFASGDPGEMCRILEAMAKERAIVDEAQGVGASVAAAYARAGDDLNGDYNRATGGGSFVSAMFPRGRFLTLASVNFDHFGFDAVAAYRAGHAAACHAAAEAAKAADEAARRSGLERAYLMNACADHFLTDLFASGHLRVPRRALHDRGWIPFVGDLLAKAMHDEDNEKGLAVRNARGDTWQAFGDQRFHEDEHATGRAFAREAVATSVAEVWAAFDGGAEPAFGALAIVPDLVDALANAANDAPLFVLDGGVVKRRARLLDRSCREYTADFDGVATLLREKLQGGT